MATLPIYAPDQLPWPLFELFLDVPHPASSAHCAPPCVVASPDSTEDLSQTVSQIACFAFPEYEGPVGQQQQQQQQALNRYDLYAMQGLGFQHFTFTMQLQSGTRLHGHVRRYLPPHSRAPTRYDIGRRGERALVLLTRGAGADSLYAAILKSVEAISSQQAALSTDLQPRAEPRRWFLVALSRYQQHLASVYLSRPVEERGKPLIAVLEGLELGINPKYTAVDVSRFILPTSLLHRPPLLDPSATNSSSSILPLLRCVGVAPALRVTASLLSERRVIMMSHSPTRLCNCSHAAISILAQGMLHWQHLYIPVLPAHLWPYLAAPYPYLIGILASMAPKLDRTDGLGEVLIINLDVNTMETRGMDQATISQRLPDMFQQAIQSVNTAASSAAAGSGVTVVQAAASPSEFLAQDLTDILRSDRRMLQGESNLANLGVETAAKATQAVKNTFFKLRDKGKQYLQNRSGSGCERETTTPPPPGEMESSPETDTKSLAADYVYTEGCRNESCEEEARIAFATFFLCMFGNMRWYLTPVGQGQVPQLDRDRFLQQKHAMGDREGTPMWPLLQNFCQTQMMEEFVKARVEELRMRHPVTPDAPLFAQCADLHRKQNIDFGVLSVRRVCYQVAQASPSRVSQLQLSARRNAMSLTSNKNVEGDYGKAVATLVEQCRESSSVLSDVMSVIWLRIRDGRGLQWKHAYRSLQLLRNLLYHGPLGAVTEATDGLDKIRALKHYENMRAQAAQQVRAAAETVYNLLVDRAKLFGIRRFCAQRRREMQEGAPAPSRNPRLDVNSPFRTLHAFASPACSAGTVVQMPAAAPHSSSSWHQPPPSDLLRVSSPKVSAEPQTDPFGLTTPSQRADSSVEHLSSTSSDVLGLFDNLSMSSGVRTPETSSALSGRFGATTPQPPPAPFVAPRPATLTTTALSSRPSSPISSSQPATLHRQQPPFAVSLNLNPVTEQSSETVLTVNPDAGYPHPHRQLYGNPLQPILPPREHQHPHHVAPSHALVTPTGADSMHQQRQQAFGIPHLQSGDTTYGAPASQQTTPQKQRGLGQLPPSRSQFDPFA